MTASPSGATPATEPTSRAELLRLLAQEHHVRQIARNGTGTPLCVCLNCKEYRAGLASTSPASAPEPPPTISRNDVGADARCPDPLCRGLLRDYETERGTIACRRCGKEWKVDYARAASPAPEPTPHLNALAVAVHAANRKWWHQADGVTPLKRNKGELLMLVVTEVAEAMEGERKDLMDDKLPHRRMAEVEIVDAIVRLLDYAAAYNYDLDGAYIEKMAYNASREDHKREAARIAAGEQF